MRAAIGNGVHIAVNAFEQDPFPHYHLTLAFPFLQFMAEQRGIPVVTQAQFRLQVIGIRFQTFVRSVYVVFHLSDRSFRYVSHNFHSLF